MKILLPATGSAYAAASLNRHLQFFSVLLAAALFCGPRAAAESPFIVDVWGTADGLPQSSVIALAPTHDGYLWLGTLNGLVRFDGHAFTCFNVNNTPGLPDNRIVFLFEDHRQNLWIGTETAGLCALKNGVVQTLTGGGTAGKITSAFEDESGAVWFCAADSRFCCWKDGRLDLHPTFFPAQLFYRAFHLVVPGYEGVSWQLQNGRVEKFRGGKPEKNFGPSPWPGAFVTASIQGRLGVSFDVNITAVAADREGNLAVGTANDGVFWLAAAGGWQPIATEQGLSHKTVLSLAFDREGNLWAGTDGGGVNRIQKKTFTAPPALHPWVAQSAAEDARGGLWVTFNGGGLSRWQTNTATDFRIGGKNNAWPVLVDDRQQVWAGTRDEGLFRLTAGAFLPVAATAPIGPQIFALFQSRDGKIWAGGQNGLARFDGQKWKIFSTTTGLPKNAVRALADDAAGNLWIGTESGGLFQLRDEKISAVAAPVTDISCLLVDSDDVLWVGTSGHGLARRQHGSWAIGSTIAGGLATDSIGYLLDDGLENLWLGSYNGLLRVGKKSFADFATGMARTVACRTFLTRECASGTQPAALRTRAGQLYFPTTAGWVSVDPAELKPNTNPPPVVIESVRVDGVEQRNNPLRAAGPVAVTLAPENEQLEIRFTSLNFSAPKRAAAGVRFRYRLEGRDQNWTDIGGEREAHFPRLPAGHYRFHVIAGNEDGVWNETGATLAVTVLPPFWRQPWFLTTTALVLLGALAAAVYLASTAKLKRQLRAARQKELIEQERARIARDLHDQLGANLTQVTLLGEMAEADKNLPGEVEQHAQQIIETARDTTRSLDEIVWSLNSANDTLEGLANYAGKYAQDYFALAGMSYRAELPTQLPATPILPEVRHNVFLAFKEAVNNVVKHAHATEARVRLRLVPGKFILEVADNGCGLGDALEKSRRIGLKNMRRRLADIHGEFEIAPGATGGTVVKLTVPLHPRDEV